jgi:hypothetical protein
VDSLIAVEQRIDTTAIEKARDQRGENCCRSAVPLLAQFGLTDFISIMASGPFLARHTHLNIVNYVFINAPGAREVSDPG